MKIKSHKELSESDTGYRITMFGGGVERETWRMVEVEIEDGSVGYYWVSTKRDGYFKQVFVPHDFDHPEIQ